MVSTVLYGVHSFVVCTEGNTVINKSCNRYKKHCFLYELIVYKYELIDYKYHLIATYTSLQC